MRPFTDILGELAAGETLETLTSDLAQMVTSFKASGKSGKLTLELTVKPNGAHGVEITDKITTKEPRDDRGSTLFFNDKDGGLHRRDPRQQDLPLRQVAGQGHDPETGEVRG